jgi:hypothetical protein
MSPGIISQSRVATGVISMPVLRKGFIWWLTLGTERRVFRTGIRYSAHVDIQDINSSFIDLHVPDRLSCCRMHHCGHCHPCCQWASGSPGPIRRHLLQPQRPEQLFLFPIIDLHPPSFPTLALLVPIPTALTRYAALAIPLDRIRNSEAATQRSRNTCIFS